MYALEHLNQNGIHRAPGNCTLLMNFFKGARKGHVPRGFEGHPTGNRVDY